MNPSFSHLSLEVCPCPLLGCTQCMGGHAEALAHFPRWVFPIPAGPSVVLKALALLLQAPPWGTFPEAPKTHFTREPVASNTLHWWEGSHISRTLRSCNSVPFPVSGSAEFWAPCSRLFSLTQLSWTCSGKLKLSWVHLVVKRPVMGLLILPPFYHRLQLLGLPDRKASGSLITLQSREEIQLIP